MGERSLQSGGGTLSSPHTEFIPAQAGTQWDAAAVAMAESSRCPRLRGDDAVGRPVPSATTEASQLSLEVHQRAVRLSLPIARLQPATRRSADAVPDAVFRAPQPTRTTRPDPPRGSSAGGRSAPATPSRNCFETRAWGSKSPSSAKATSCLALDRRNAPSGSNAPSGTAPTSSENSRRAAASRSSPGSIRPLGMDQAAASFPAQNGPPGCTSSSSRPDGRARCSRIPAEISGIVQSTLRSAPRHSRCPPACAAAPGDSVSTSSSVGRTRPACRWPASALPSRRPSTAWTCTAGRPSGPSAMSPLRDATSTCSSTGIGRYRFCSQSKKARVARSKAPMAVKLAASNPSVEAKRVRHAIASSPVSSTMTQVAWPAVSWRRRVCIAELLSLPLGNAGATASVAALLRGAWPSRGTAAAHSRRRQSSRPRPHRRR